MAMDRSFSRRLCLVSLLVALLAIPLTGCVNVFTTVAYLVYGTNVDAEYDGLKNQKVAVVVKPPSVTINADQEAGARELAQQIGDFLQANVRGITVIEQQEVDKWKDDLRNNPDDAREIGKALEADAVVSVELQDFKLFDNSSSVYRGRADYQMHVYQLTGEKAGKVVYHFEPTSEALFPPNSGIPIGELRRPEFRRVFVKYLAEEIARHFYAHDAHASVARDADALKYH
jgi:hypothetical protein